MTTAIVTPRRNGRRALPVLRRRRRSRYGVRNS